MSQTEEFSKGQPDKTIQELPNELGWNDSVESSFGNQDSNYPPGQTLYLVGLAFFLSGLSALIYEIVWQRVLVRVIGATTPAVATIVCAYMIGLAIGGFVGVQLAKRRGNQLLVLAILELSISIIALISVFLCQNSNIIMLTSLLVGTVGSDALRLFAGFLIVFVLIAVPTSLMGATLPIVAGFFANSAHSGILLTRFYSINSAGAVFGALLSGFFLLPMLGISGSLIFAVGLNLLSSSLAFLASRSVHVSQLSTLVSPSEAAGDPAQMKAAPLNSRSNQTYFNASLVLVTSALSFTMQMVWTRFFVFLFGSSTYALSLVLSVYIAGISLGAWLVSREKRPSKNSRIYAFIGISLSAASLAMASVLHLFQWTPIVFLYVKKFLLGQIGAGFTSDSLAMILIAIPLILLPSLTTGMVFPLFLNVEGNAAREEQSSRSLSRRTAILYSASLLGSVAATTYSFTLMPVISQNYTSGLEMTTFLTSILFALASLIFIVKTFGKHCSASMFNSQFRQLFSNFIVLDLSNARNEKIAVTTCAFCIVILLSTGGLLLLRPQWDAILISSGLSNLSADDFNSMSVPKLIDALKSNTDVTGPAQKLLMYREGLNSTVSVVSRQSKNLTYLRNNGKVEAAVPSDPFFPAPESDLPTQKLLGLIPAILSTGDNIDGLVIGYGSGTTCSAILSAPWIQHLTAVELERAVWDARSYFPSVFSANGQNVEQLKQKLTPVIADARNFLSLHETKFDFIVSQPAEPWLSGASDLFTVEFYQLIRKRLKDDSLFCQWVPLYSLTPAQLRCLVQTFQHVFPQTTIWHPKGAGELILLGQVGERIAPSVILKRLESDSISAELQKIGIENQFDLYSNAIQLPPSINQSLEDIVLNTDDNLLIECKLAREMNSSTHNIDENFRRVFGEDANLSYDMPNFEPSVDNDLERVLALFKHKSGNRSFATDTTFLHAVSNNEIESMPAPAIPKDLNSIAQLRFHLRTGSPERAAQILKSLGSERGDNQAALSDLGTLQFLIGDYKTALKYFENAETLSTRNDAQTKAGIGLCLWMLDSPEKAIKPLTASLSLSPNQFLARYALGQALMTTGHQSEAMINMRAAALVSPASAWPGIFVTAKNIERHDWKSADANLQLVLKRQPLMPEAIALGALIALRSERMQDYIDLKSQYKRITTRDITENEMESLVKSILSSPHIITKLEVN